MYSCLLDILFPRRCPVCGRIVPFSSSSSFELPPFCGSGKEGFLQRPLICPGCIAKLSWVTAPVCKRCGKEIVSDTAEYCFDCSRHKRTFDRGMAIINYNETASRSLSQIKYNNRREYLDFYGEAMFRILSPAVHRLHPDVMVPVPVHPSRLKKRGFNQAEELAKRLSAHFSSQAPDFPDFPEIPTDTSLLFRSKKTLPQKNLDPSQRLKNLEQAFFARPLPPQIKKILLIDDIYTTGSTAEACARALKKAGAEKVYFAVVAIGSGR